MLRTVQTHFISCLCLEALGKGVVMNMNNRELLPKSGNWYKANLHCHTVLSDGKWTKEQVKEEYRKKGYSIVAFTDHRHYGWHPELQDENFLPIAGFEADMDEPYRIPGDWNRCKTYHLNFYDTNPAAHAGFTAPQPPQRYGDMYSLNAFIKELNEQRFLCCYNHPFWSLQNYEDYKDLRGLFAMEIYNHGCELDGLYGYAPQSYDEMLRTGMQLTCLATDDNHDRHPLGDPLNDSFGGWTVIRAQTLTYPDVMDALQKGAFYASTGPELKELFIQDNALHIRCSPVEKIYVITESRSCKMKLACPVETIDEAVFPLTGNEGYIRVDCRDAAGHHAYSNAYRLNVL